MTRPLHRLGPFAGLPAAFWKLWLATLVNRLGGFVVPFLAIFLQGQRGLSTAEAGTILAFFGAGSVVAGPLGGVLADRVGRKATIVLGMLSSAASMLWLALAGDGAALVAGCFFLGLAFDLPRPATSAMVADLVPEADRPRAYSAMYWAANLGFACASLLAGVFASASFTALFIVDAATSLACGAILWFSLPETRPERRETTRSKALSDAIAPFRSSDFTGFFVASLLIAVVFFQFNAAMPLDMMAHQITTAEYGVLVAMNGILVVTLQPFLGPLALRVRRGRALAIASTLTGAGFGMLGLAGSFAGYALAITTLTLGEIVMAPMIPAVVAELAPRHLRGTYQGALQLSFSLASCAAPLLGGFLLAGPGAGVLWSGCFVVGLLAAALHLALDGPRQRRSRELAAAGALAV